MDSQIQPTSSNSKVLAFHDLHFHPNFQGQNFVLRKKPPGKLLPGAHAIEREYRVMEALSKHGVPMPPLHGLCTDSSVLGTPFYLMSYVPGRIFKDPSLPGLSPADRRKVYAAMNRTIAQVGWHI